MYGLNGRTPCLSNPLNGFQYVGPKFGSSVRSPDRVPSDGGVSEVTSGSGSLNLSVNTTHVPTVGEGDKVSRRVTKRDTLSL